RNPLCNYENVSDILHQSYAELTYAAMDDDWSSLNFRYIGGLTLFTKLSDRNYYEHSLRAEYSLRLRKNTEEAEDDTTEVNPADSTNSFFQASLGASARHDRTIFREYDNAGLSGRLAYRIPIGEENFVRASMTAGARSYLHLSGLTNLSGICAVEIGSQYHGDFQWGIILGAGLMQYPHAAYDTSRFEETPAYVITITATNSGSGKGGIAYDTSIASSEKLLLARPKSQSSYQLQGGMYCTLSWNSGSLRCDGLFRRNFSMGVHSLLLNMDTSHLNEDIYNDFFSYEGPELTLSMQQLLPFEIQSTCTVGSAVRSFSIPAMDLDGNVTSPTRTDVNTAIEIFLSHGISLFGYSGIEISLGTSYMRNKSNDFYNDCSQWSLMAGLGINL
ncbi:MAG: hypothetical protein NTV54_14070, partial [Ignavibacteriales bacterium]|nr:hypothetical protein [Ignavibacteriales bacterium]